ncbi:MAG: hypothetical protein HFE88_04625 [Acutalibacter sp.]|nr:hypothetical protein [Acutalibacter sp.]
MPKFYFTYGIDPAYPFQGGWTEITAQDRPMACAIFRKFHPDRKGSCGLLNCADIYNENEFLKSELVAGNYGADCHERITLSREVLTFESEAT